MAQGQMPDELDDTAEIGNGRLDENDEQVSSALLSKGSQLALQHSPLPPLGNQALLHPSAVSAGDRTPLKVPEEEAEEESCCCSKGC